MNRGDKRAEGSYESIFNAQDDINVASGKLKK